MSGAQLARFQTNQFRLHNGMEADSEALTCSGLYAFISRTNHSCEPTVAIVPKSTFCGWRGVPWTLEDSGGTLLAYALRDLSPGDRISFNYGPDEMISEGWEVQKRRAYLGAKLGFVCCCAKCVRDVAREAAMEARAKGAPARAPAEAAAALEESAQEKAPAQDDAIILEVTSAETTAQHQKELTGVVRDAGGPGVGRITSAIAAAGIVLAVVVVMVRGTRHGY